MQDNRKEQGFTLMEMLIVVAIIAILIAIAIPTFTSQLEKAREATDAANIRAAYAEVMMQAVEDPTASPSEDVTLQQSVEGWATTTIESSLSGLFEGGISGKPGAGKTATVSFDNTTSKASLSFA